MLPAWSQPRRDTFIISTICYTSPGGTSPMLDPYTHSLNVLQRPLTAPKTPSSNHTCKVTQKSRRRQYLQI